MKKILFFLPVLLLAGALSAQLTSNRTATINVSGSRNKQIIIDDITYPVTTSAYGQQTIVVNNLSLGPHTLELVRSGLSNVFGATDLTNFTVRQGYDLQINVSSNGTVNVTEVPVLNHYPRQGQGQGLNSYAFTRLYNNARGQFGASARANYLENEFSGSNRYYTSQQAQQLIQLVNSENLRLRLAKDVYPDIIDRENFSLVSSLLYSRFNRAELSRYIATLPADEYNDGVDNSEHYPSNYGNPMSTYEFGNLYRNVSSTWSSNRINLITQAFQNNNNYFTVDQVHQLISLVNNESDRLVLAKDSYNNITDRSNFSQLYDLFSNTSYRSELARYVSDYQTGNTTTYPGYRTPMSTPQFSQIYDDVQHTFGLGAKMNALRDIFNNRSNYFTVEQTHMLIQLVTSESNRLELAKSAYNNLTDQSNFTRLYDLFEYQSSKDELNAYVNANPHY